MEIWFLAPAIAGAVYMLLALQLWGGVPPVYARPKAGDAADAMLRRVVPWAMGMAASVMLGVVSGRIEAALAVGFCGLCAGLAARRRMRAETRGLRGWVLSAPVIAAIPAAALRNPMLVFDAWTAGGAALAAALILL
ncbi:hypothetical protein ACQ5SO_06775 [Rhodovulum sp. DZ06]|uniref:hypothetical protein n=1 Tax=Rhodovulum sp. DZ06 TaxID=3425126 RepID=UPI003D34FE40